MIGTYINDFFFGFYPYVCLTVFVVGSIMRYDRDQYTWKADSSMLLRKKGMRLYNYMFHIGVLFLFCGHLVGLLTPHAVYEVFITSSQKVVLAMVSGGIFGLICLAGISFLLYRRLYDPRIRAASKPTDTLILVLVFIQLILGLISILFSAQHLDGSSMVRLAGWAQHIVTFREGAAGLIMEESLIFKLHIILGMTLFLLFPFTRLVHIFSGVAAPIKYIYRSGYQIVRKRG